MNSNQKSFKYPDAANTGLALIFYVDKFKGEEVVALRLDADGLKQMLLKFGFNVKVFSNLTEVQAIQVLSDISQEKEVEEKNCLNKPMSMEKFTPNFKNDKCFLAVFLSHGKDGSIVMKKGLLNIADNILQHFRGDSCKNLLEKPKIFIFGNCQGCEDETPVAKPISDNLGTYERDDEGEVSIFIPAGADFLLCYASEKSTRAYYNKNQGSWYIQSIVQALKEMVEDKTIRTDNDFVSLMTTVSEKVAEFSWKKKEEIKVQIPYFISTLRSKVYLRLPPLQDHNQEYTEALQPVDEEKNVNKDN